MAQKAEGKAARQRPARKSRNPAETAVYVLYHTVRGTLHTERRHYMIHTTASIPAGTPVRVDTIRRPRCWVLGLSASGRWLRIPSSISSSSMLRSGSCMHAQNSIPTSSLATISHDVRAVTSVARASRTKHVGTDRTLRSGRPYHPPLCSQLSRLAFAFCIVIFVPLSEPGLSRRPQILHDHRHHPPHSLLLTWEKRMRGPFLAAGPSITVRQRCRAVINIIHAASNRGRGACSSGGR